MTTYVLVLMLSGRAEAAPVTVTSLEFPTLANCEHAGAMATSSWYLSGGRGAFSCARVPPKELPVSSGKEEKTR